MDPSPSGSTPEPGPAEPSRLREHSFGQDWSTSPVDRLGIWLSLQSIRRHTGGLTGRRAADFGAGYEATLSRNLAPLVGSMIAVDIKLGPAVHDDPHVRAVEGALPGVLATLPDQSLDLVLCISVLEHLDEPDTTLREFRRLLAPGGRCLINVPSWLGKRFLELSAFKLGLSPAEEMDDHRRYYDPKDLWPDLVAAGFRPRNIRCFRHKLGLNTFAVCRVPADGEPQP